MIKFIIIQKYKNVKRDTMVLENYFYSFLRIETYESKKCIQMSEKHK